MDVAVAGCSCDLAMEEQVGIDAALLPALFAAHAVERCLDRVEILLAAARGGECGRFRFQDAAQLEQPLHVLAVLQRLAVDADRGALFWRQHKGADTLARFDQAVGPQLRDGFAHDIAANAEFLRKLLFGRQAGSGIEIAGGDLATDEGGDALRQRLYDTNGGQTLLHREISAQGTRQPGFIKPLGSSADLSAMTSRRCAGDDEAQNGWLRVRPMPCSALIEPSRAPAMS